MRGRIIAAVAVAMAVVLMPAGLRGQAKGEPIRLLLWQGFKFEEITLLEQNLRDFERDYEAKTGQAVRIETGMVPFDSMTKRIRSAAQARSVPDIAIVDANSMVQFVYGGVARPIDEVPGFPAGGIAGLRELYVPGAFDTNVVTFRGKTHLYGIPAQTTTLALFYNKEMFRAVAAELRAAGCDPDRAPRDWDEFIRYGKVLTQPDKGIYAFGMNNSFWFSMPYFNMYGVDIVRRNEAGLLEAAMKGPRAEAAVARRMDMYLKHKIEGGAWREGALDPDQGFLNRRYAMVLGGPWMIENFRSSGIDFGIALIPRVPLAEAKSLGLVPEGATEDSPEAQALTAGNIGGQNMMISTTCPHPEIALAFGMYFTGEKVQRQWAEQLGQIPVLKAAQSNLDLSKYPEVPVLIEQINSAKALPALPNGGVLEVEIVNPELNLVLQGRQTPAQALERICERMTARILRAVNEAEAAAAEDEQAGN